MIEAVLCFLIVLFTCWNILLPKIVTYPLYDTCSLFVHGHSRIDGYSIAKNFVTLCGGDITSTATSVFFEKMPFYHYNIYLYIFSRLPKGDKIRQWQMINFILLIIIVMLSSHIMFILLDSVRLGAYHAIIISFVFALIIVCRSKIIFISYLGLSDILNYVLYLLSIYLFLLNSDANSLFIIFIIGCVVGLSYRNRSQDVILFIAAIVYLMSTNGVIVNISILIFGFLVSISDLLLKAFTATNDVEIFGNLMRFRSNSTNSEIYKIGRYVIYLRNIIRLLNLYGKSSIWHSVGGLAILTPVSVVYLLYSNMFNQFFIFIVAYCLLLLMSGICVSHHIYNERGLSVQSYFSGRQMYPLYVGLALINGYCFAITISVGSLLSVVYMLYLSLFVFSQFHKLADYYLSESIIESGLIEYPKAPPAWSVELSSIVKSLPGKSVVMGDHFIFGKVYNFYKWDNSLRCVDIYSHFSDEEILNVIKRYGVTDIFLTPFSCLRHNGSTFASENLWPQILNILKREPTGSPSLVHYSVRQMII